MKFVLDVHCHTIASGHAYSTIDEIAGEAAGKGLKMIAITDHGPAIPNGAHPYHFYNMIVLPEYIKGVRILRGIESNIIDLNGRIDVPDDLLQKMELRIASLHPPCINPGTKAEHTDALAAICKNPLIDVIGHPGDSRFDFDILTVVRAAGETGTLLEINNSSLTPISYRPGSRVNIIKILEICRKEGVPVVLGSDAHYAGDIGNFCEVEKLIAETNFPEELILNRSVEKFLEYIEQKLRTD